jgi:hypothetical protein
LAVIFVTSGFSLQRFFSFSGFFTTLFVAPEWRPASYHLRDWFFDGGRLKSHCQPLGYFFVFYKPEQIAGGA